jgi:RNA polymerase sigma factor (sigma-70 family)
MPDQEIIHLIRLDKTDKALDALYKNFPMVYKMIKSTGGNIQDAEDVFQEALIILYRKIKETDFKLTARLSTYLFSVCRFLWKDELKKRKYPVTPDFETGFPAEEEQSFGIVVEKENQAKLAEKVLNELGDRCRELLLLFYHSGLKLKEIASRMGYSSENTAKNQKYKCLETARNKLKEMKMIIQTH